MSKKPPKKKAENQKTDTSGKKKKFIKPVLVTKVITDIIGSPTALFAEYSQDGGGGY